MMGDQLAQLIETRLESLVWEYSTSTWKATLRPAYAFPSDGGLTRHVMTLRMLQTILSLAVPRPPEG